MKYTIFIALAAFALLGLVACAPGTTTSTVPTTAAQAGATITSALGAAPTLAATETTAATTAATSEATSAATSAATSEATSAATSAATSGAALGTATSPASAPTVETTPAATSEATSAATSAATAAATSAATTAATAAATGAATSAATSAPGGTPTGLVTVPAATSAAAGPAPAQTITVIGTEFKFDPNQITLKVGQRVRIVFQNKGTVDHELEVEDLKADNVVLDLTQAGTIPEDQRDETMGDAQNGSIHPYAAAGGTATIDFTPTTPGTFNFACNLPGHKEAGMTGTITVTP